MWIRQRNRIISVLHPPHKAIISQTIIKKYYFPNHMLLRSFFTVLDCKNPKIELFQIIQPYKTLSRLLQHLTNLASRLSLFRPFRQSSIKIFRISLLLRVSSHPGRQHCLFLLYRNTFFLNFAFDTFLNFYFVFEFESGRKLFKPTKCKTMRKFYLEICCGRSAFACHCFFIINFISTINAKFLLLSCRMFNVFCRM